MQVKQQTKQKDRGFSGPKYTDLLFTHTLAVEGRGNTWQNRTDPILIALGNQLTVI